MILRREGPQPRVNGSTSPGHFSDPPKARADTGVQPAIELASDIATRHEISALSGLLSAARTVVAPEEITVAVLGRFKAGKSSFLNDFFGRAVLPAGVVPVTAVITEIRYGPGERACVRHTEGPTEEIPLGRIGEYISERENPENAKQVELISIELPGD